MFKLFKSDRLAKAFKAIDADDLTKLQKHLQKLEPEEINQPVSDDTAPLAEVCILKQAPKALKLVLNFGANADQMSHTNPTLSLAELSLGQEKSLPLLTALYTAGAKTDPTPLLQQCFDHCSEQELMLHLSVLLQYGGQLDDELVHKALASDQLPLIHFIINSGASCPDDIDKHNYPEETLNYAKKCWDDQKIRAMFLS
ncbi:hypothetical protein ACMXYW_02305 [Neptuniibacter sp. QD48_55]|uniref:hypothetical protein n=1 Tax=Neptuniibacter sp. QD48_55 TaxID=3398212 RepID=UPI0039F50243